ncbi:protein kinase family protein [Pseudomonas germanica]|uniref:hypothetical protein n=1 Tax=Pseudomonas germanica TaxID=2815720 RepID=UPI002A4E2BEF|nr:hypothetical protein [Pseudomonas germanica]WPN75666.1 hypothetical protein QMK46_04695 [Pseudomonas germanica]
MRKLFSLKIDLDFLCIIRILENNNTETEENYGLYDFKVQNEKISGVFWQREKSVILNEFNITTTEPLTFFKVNRFDFKIQPIKNKEFLLNIQSSSKSIKEFLKFLQEQLNTKVYISQIDVFLPSLISYLKEQKPPLLKITHAYATNTTLSSHEKITFSIYSDEDAIRSANKALNIDSIVFDRVKIQSFLQGIPGFLDIRSNCLYNITKESSELEHLLINYIINALSESRN